MGVITPLPQKQTKTKKRGQQLSVHSVISTRTSVISIHTSVIDSRFLLLSHE
jgi:hypothetical protein